MPLVRARRRTSGALSPHGAVGAAPGYPGMLTAESRRSRIPDCIDSG